MSLVKRMHNKIAPKFGCCHLVLNQIHHKNSVEKLLVICAIAIVPFENDIRFSDTMEKIYLTCFGGMVTATNDSYPRLEVENDSYTYLKDPKK